MIITQNNNSNNFDINTYEIIRVLNSTSVIMLVYVKYNYCTHISL